MNDNNADLWRQNAACLGYPTDQFYLTSVPKRVQRMCQHCPVNTECLVDALEWEAVNPARHTYGYRAGMYPRERIAMTGRKR